MSNYNIKTITAMFSEDKVTDIFYLADEFCKFFNVQQEKSMLEAPNDGRKHCRNQRIHIHKTFDGLASRGKCSTG